MDFWVVIAGCFVAHTEDNFLLSLCRSFHKDMGISENVCVKLEIKKSSGKKNGCKQWKKWKKSKKNYQRINL